MVMSLPELQIAVDTTPYVPMSESLLVVGAFKKDNRLFLTPSADKLDRTLDQLITRHYDRGIFTAEAGSVLFLTETDDFPKGTAVIGLGERQNLTGETLKNLLEKAAPLLAAWSDDLAFTAQEWITERIDEKCAARLFSATLLNTLQPRKT
ncbi:protein containing Peptidase M17, leucyl aminopeptidase, partial [gut metagenome]